MQILGEEKPARSNERDGDDGKRVSAPDGKRDKPNPEEIGSEKNVVLDFRSRSEVAVAFSDALDL